MLEGGTRQPLRHQRRHRAKETIPQGKLVPPALYLSKKRIVIQLREFRGEFPQRVAARRLLNCHSNHFLNLSFNFRYSPHLSLMQYRFYKWDAIQSGHPQLFFTVSEYTAGIVPPA